eukprot:scaffold421168_cov17-Prasinocladus_malaysianus.AAC.1
MLAVRIDRFYRRAVFQAVVCALRRKTVKIRVCRGSTRKPSTSTRTSTVGQASQVRDGSRLRGGTEGRAAPQIVKGRHGVERLAREAASGDW